MPLCVCISHGCGKSASGTERDKRTIEKHQLADYRLLASQARDEELRKTDEAIATFVTSMSLADKASGSTTKSGSRLWSLAPPAQADVDIMEAHINEYRSSNPTASPISRKRQVDGFLDRLKAIEKRLNDLSSNALYRIANMRSPSSAGEAFPLEQDLQLAKDLHSDLLRIKSGFNEVIATRQVLVEHVEKLLQDLKTEKETWRDACVRAEQPTSAAESSSEGPLKYNSG